MGQKCNCICTKDNENTFSFISDAMFTRDDDHSNFKGKFKAFDSNLLNQVGVTQYDNDIQLKSESKDYLEKYVTQNLKSLILIQKHIKGWLFRIHFISQRKELQSISDNLYSGFISRMMTPQIKNSMSQHNEFEYNACLKEVLSYSSADEKLEIQTIHREFKSGKTKLFHKQVMCSPDLKTMYRGSVTIDDKKHGVGKLFMSSGDIYEGCWINDRFLGCGLLMKNDGSIIQGKELFNIRLF